MTDTKLLDGNVDEVKSGLGGLDAATLGDLLAAEQAGKNRKGVIDALEEAQTTAANPTGRSTTYTSTTDRGDASAATRSVNVAPGVIGTAAALDTSGPADVAPATAFSTSGAPVQTVGIEPEHPAVDNNPRANTTADMNRIDFNDPVREGSEVVAESLKGADTDAA